MATGRVLGKPVNKVLREITVGLVDDEKPVLESLASLLAGWKMLCVGAHSEPTAALSDFQSSCPQVVLMDIRMPRMSGIDCTRLLKASLPSTAVIMLTRQSDVGSLLQSFQAGAGGYVVKGNNVRVVREAITRALGGGALVSEEVRQKLAATPFDRAQCLSCTSGLSRREEDVQDLICQGLDDKHIAERLSLSVNSIKGIKRNLFAKQHVHSRSELILNRIAERAPAANLCR
jgi:DNA-binding NarL/FixJ family response regulator